MENSSSPRLPDLPLTPRMRAPQPEPGDLQPSPRFPSLPSLRARQEQGAAEEREPATPGNAAGVRDGGAAEGRICAPLRAARSALPVVAVIFERREVLLQVPVRLLEPLAQVLELAAERGLEGRVLGVHARARPPAPDAAALRSRARVPCSAAPPFVLLPSPALSSRLPIGGCRRAGRDREEEEQVAGSWGGGAEGGGAGGRAQGAAASTRGCGKLARGGREKGDGVLAPPRRRGLSGGRGRAHLRPPRERETSGGVQQKVICCPGKSIKGHSRSCSSWGREETGGDSRKENAGRTREPLLAGKVQGLEAAPSFSTTDSSLDASPTAPCPPPPSF